jgi:hypothetical protein
MRTDHSLRNDSMCGVQNEKKTFCFMKVGDTQKNSGFSLHISYGREGCYVAYDKPVEMCWCM